MSSAKLMKNVFLSLLYLMIVLASTSCVPKSSYFGIVFISSRFDSLDIYRISDNTQSKPEQLTFTPTIGEYHLLVSKNGERIVFEAGPTTLKEEPSEANIEKPQHIYLLDTTSMKVVDITNVLVKYETVSQNFNMDWSPDQKQFTVIADQVTGSEVKSFLKLVDVDGKNKKDILIPTTSTVPSVISSVKWSPDGEKVVLTLSVIGNAQQLQNPGSAIFVYNLKSGKSMRIADYKDQCLPREWSPASRQIAATCGYSIPAIEGFSGPETVRILDVENPDQPNKHLAFSSCKDPSWSPDGKQMAFVCNKDEDHMGLFIVNSDGNGIREIQLGQLGTPAVLKNPTWSPTGDQIIYVAGSDVNSQNIYSIHLDGSNNHPLTHQDGYYQIVSVYPLQ